MSSPSEASGTSSSLLARLRAGEPPAWDRLLAVYGPLVWHWCRSCGLREQDGADVAQDVFGAVAGRLDSFRERPAGSFRGWLRVITRNKIRDLMRRRRREPDAAGGSEALRWLGEVATPADEEASAIDDGRALVVRRVLELLRPEFAESTWRAFWQTAVDGRPAADAAAELGLSAGAVRVAKCRVLRRLRDELASLSEG